MSATPTAKDAQSRDGLALMDAGEITVSMKLDEYHAIQKTIAETNWVRGQTKGQVDLISYLYMIIIEKKMKMKDLTWGAMPKPSFLMLEEIFKKFGVGDEDET